MQNRIPFSSKRRSWPAEARALLQEAPSNDRLQKGILAMRCNRELEAQKYLLAAGQKACSDNEMAMALDALAGLCLRRHNLESCGRLLEVAFQLCAKTDGTSPTLPSLELRQHQLEWAKGIRTAFVPSGTDQRELDPLEKLQWLQCRLVGADTQTIKQLIDAWPPELDFPEALEIRARALKAIGSSKEAFEGFAQLLAQTEGSAHTWAAVLELNHLNQRSNGLALATASRLHPHDPVIATHRVLILLHERQPAQARRAAFKERLLYSLGRQCPSQKQSDSNLVAAYDQTGRADLTPYLHHTLLRRLTDSPPLHANITMQLASQASPLYGKRAETHASTFTQRTQQKRHPRHSPLRVGFISPDLYYHPVGRFVQMLLSAGFGRAGELHLVNTGAPAMKRLQELSAGNIHNISGKDLEEQTKIIDRLDLDIAVDLTGWTGENNGELFARRVAPIQVNYLGYFASSGLPTMDLWLGDHSLFPNPMKEWHSERIVRLKRPFIAWQPDEHLAEGRVAVPPAPTGGVTFGCFNHVRKLSHFTLSLWGRLLREIPDSRLALKAFNSDDPGVVALVEKRMQDCGLDPDAVIWLPTCPKPEDHLRQYGLIDIALDPHPNGGCTTTCEALWMGVPVITLSGSHYVSRMSTAVLNGSSLSEWVASSPEAYLQLASQAAKQIGHIRASRPELRAHIQRSPLGNAADLADNLWQCFEELS